MTRRHALRRTTRESRWSPYVHAFHVTGRLVRLDEGVAVSVRCRCAVTGAPSCVDPCETCGGVGEHRTVIQAGAIRCEACSYVRPLDQPGRRPADGVDRRTW